MNATRTAAYIALAALVSLGIGCSQNTVPPPIVCPEYEIGESLLYPAPGATGVPTNIHDLIVSLPADGTFELTSAAGIIMLGTSVPVPSPAPTVLPTSSAEPITAFRAVPVPALSPATTYAVQYQAPKTNATCGSHELNGALGSFST